LVLFKTGLGGLHKLVGTGGLTRTQDKGLEVGLNAPKVARHKRRGVWTCKGTLASLGGCGACPLLKLGKCF